MAPKKQQGNNAKTPRVKRKRRGQHSKKASKNINSKDYKKPPNRGGR